MHTHFINNLNNDAMIEFNNIKIK